MPTERPCVRTLLARHVGAVAVTEALHPPRGTLPTHGIGAPTLSYVLAGEVTECSPRHPRTAGLDEALLRPVESSHIVVGETGARLLHLSGLEIAHDRDWHDVADTPLAVLLLALRGELYRDDGTAERHREALVLSVSNALRARLPTSVARGETLPAWLSDALAIVQARSRCDVTVGGIASAVGVHRVTLARGFSRRLGLTIGRYLRLLRLRDALRAIVLDGVPTPRAAVRAGFYDQSHLNRWLRRETGTTPGRLTSPSGIPALRGCA